MEEKLRKAGVVNLGPVYNQTNNITIIESHQVKLVYSDPIPDLTHFQGRHSELKKLGEWLEERSVCLIGVKGEGGIGKSTLTAKVFTDCSGFAGKCWIDVRTETSITEISKRALLEFGLSSQQVQTIEEKDLPQRLLRYLQTERCLLAIDNLESLLSHDGVWQSGYEEFLDQFQTLGSGSVLLLAGREYPLKYFGWQRSEWLALETGLEPLEGAALLAALEVEGTEEEQATISIQVQGKPLALSLLAGWLREEYRKDTRLVQHLTQQSELFQVEGTHRGEKRISVEGVFNWSFNRLTLKLQHLLTQVSVLRGAFNVEATIELVQGTVNDVDLQELERRSLLQQLTEPDKFGLKQYRLQPQIQKFAQKRAEDLTKAHKRAIDYFWKHRQTTLTPESGQEAVREYLETSYHQFQLGNYQQAAQAVFSCDDFLRSLGNAQILLSIYTQLYDNWQPSLEQRQDYAYLCYHLGSIYNSLSQYQQAFNFLGQSLTISRELNDRHQESLAINGLASVYNGQGQYQQAIDLYEQTLKIVQELGYRMNEAIVLTNLGVCYRYLGQYQKSIDLYHQANAIYEELGNKQRETNSLAEDSSLEFVIRPGISANLLNQIGYSYQCLGMYPQAIDLCQQALAISQQFGQRQQEGYCLGNLGIIYRYLGQYQKSIDFLKQALAIDQEFDNKHSEANILNSLGNVYLASKHPKQAMYFYEQALAIEREIGNRQGEADNLGNLGSVYHSLGRNQQAKDFYEQTLVIVQELNDKRGEATAFANLSHVYNSLKRYQQAVDLLDQSIAIFLELREPLSLADVLFKKARSLMKLQQYPSALECLKKALDLYRLIELDHKIKPCEAEIYKVHQMIFEEQRQQPPLPDWYIKSLPANEKKAASNTTDQSFSFWLWSLAGLAIVLLIWWLKK